MIFYTADPHFGHAKMIASCSRPFRSVTEMDEGLIANWNRRVGEDDLVYLLGDFCFGAKDPAALLSRLCGRKRLILGNHDDVILKRAGLSDYFESVEAFAEIEDEGRRITLCHYPLLTWKEPKDSFMIHGHIHNSTSADFWPLLAVRDNVLNAGVDVNGFSPVPFDELLENNRRFKREHS